MGSSARAVPAPVLLGLDFGGTKTAAAVAAPDGRVLHRRTVPTAAGDGAEAVLQRGLGLAHELVESAAGAPGSPGGVEVVGVGACTFGIPFDDRVELAATIPGWSQVPFAERVRQAFPGAAVRVSTDVKSAASVEASEGALQGCDPGLYVNLGTGLAVGVVVGGRVVSGRHGAAGEIGYSLRRLADVGRPPAARGILEDAVSGQGLARQASERCGQALSAAEVFADAGEPVRRGLVEEFLRELCFHLVNLATALDVERVAVGGGLTRSWDVIGPALRAALEAGVPFPPSVTLARYPHDGALRGALADAHRVAGQHEARDVVA